VKAGVNISLDIEVARELQKATRGQPSRFVNELLKRKLGVKVPPKRRKGEGV
jgi:hypothetical protein